MSNKLRITFTAIAMSFAAMIMTTQSASAGSASIEFRFGGPHGPVFHVKPRKRHFCSTRHAAKIARHHYGVRHAHIRQSRRSIQVSGYRHGHRVSITFANQRGCPVIAHKRRR